MIVIPNHTLVTRLALRPKQREVWQTQYGGRSCVTRVLIGDPQPKEFAGLIKSVVTGGRGSAVALAENVQLTIEGYRVATHLTTTITSAPRWPRVLDAGLTENGYVYVTTEWMEGQTLQRAKPADHQTRVLIAQSVANILATLHYANIAYGDLKADNLIIGPAGQVSLIDLDTMREVPGPLLAVPLRDLTPSWAAPEQRHDSQTYLASDLWAFGILIRELFAEGVPEPWQPLVDACRHPQPLERPQTASLLARMHVPSSPLLNWYDEPIRPHSAEASGGIGNADRTERVEEQGVGETERVPETTGATAPKAPSAFTQPGPARDTSLRGCLIIAVAVSVLSIGGCAGLVGWWDMRQVGLANNAADEALAALKSYKTRPEVNRDTSQRTVIRVQADGAWETRATPHSAAVRALALVWEQGWQDASRKWDPERYEAATAALKGAGEREPATWLARATVEGGACRLNRADAMSAAHCDRALEALSTLKTVLPDSSDWSWMRVEAAWTEVLVRGELAGQAVNARSAEAPQRLATVLAACDAAAPYLEYGPVNAVELEQDCLNYAGLSQDWVRYYALADSLFSRSGVDKTTVTHAYRAAGEQCADTTVNQKRGEWVIKGPVWCTAVGHAARGCVELAWDTIAKNQPLYRDLEWDQLAASLNGRADRCRK